MSELIFRIRKSHNKKQPFYWELQASNDYVHFRSKNYVTKQGAENNIKNIIRGFSNGDIKIKDMT